MRHDQRFAKFLASILPDLRKSSISPWGILLIDQLEKDQEDLIPQFSQVVGALEPSLIGQVLRYPQSAYFRILLAHFKQQFEPNSQPQEAENDGFRPLFIQGLIESENPPSSLDVFHENVPEAVSVSMMLLAGTDYAASTLRQMMDQGMKLKSPNLQYLLQNLLFYLPIEDFSTIRDEYSEQLEEENLVFLSKLVEQVKCASRPMTEPW